MRRIEAAAAGIATVGTRVGHVADWAPDAAVAVEPGDSNALAAAVTDLLNQPVRRRALGDQARARSGVHDRDFCRSVSRPVSRRG